MAKSLGICYLCLAFLHFVAQKWNTARWVRITHTLISWGVLVWFQISLLLFILLIPFALFLFLPQIAFSYCNQSHTTCCCDQRPFSSECIAHMVHLYIYPKYVWQERLSFWQIPALIFITEKHQMWTSTVQTNECLPLCACFLSLESRGRFGAPFEWFWRLRLRPRLLSRCVADDWFPVDSRGLPLSLPGWLPGFNLWFTLDTLRSFQ